MFEKEAKEWANKMYPSDGQAQRYLLMGAMFGYNKANEWHYVKDGDLPKDMENVIINALDYGINTCYVAHRLNGKWRSNCSFEIFVRVVAWKEIVLPEENQMKVVQNVQMECINSHRQRRVNK